jgi:hypothetical protein
MVDMASRRWLLGMMTAFVGGGAAQVIEFESGGLKYQTQTKNGVTVMFAPMPMMVREYAVLQVAVSNGSQTNWLFKPDDFLFRRTDGATIQPSTARAVVSGFIERGGRDDVVKLVSAYEMGLYGMSRLKSTNGYESRRQSAMAEMTSARLKAAAAASAIVFTPVKLKPGESTDGAVFYPTGGKPLGPGKLTVQVAGAVFVFDAQPGQTQPSH